MTDDLRLHLPWPPVELNPNQRLHWARRAKVKAAYRARCHDTVAELVDLIGVTAPCGPIELTIEFCPPDRRKRDRDNLVATMKAGFDGMCDALAIDDSRFDTVVARVGEDIIRGGKVRVCLRSMPSSS